MTDVIGEAAIVITADGSDARDELDDLADERRTAAIDVDVNGKEARARLALLARKRNIPFHVKLNKSSVKAMQMSLARLSGARALWDWGKAAKEFALNLDKMAPKLGAVVSGIGGITSAGGSLVGFLGTALTQLGSLSALALPLPGMFIGAGAAMGVLVAAFKDGKEELKGLSDGFGELQDIISANFWSVAREPIIDMVDNLMPMFNDTLGTMAYELGEFLGAAAGAAGSEKNVAGLSTIFDATSIAIDNSTKGIDNWVNGIIGLGEAGARYLPGIGDWFSDMGVAFDEWVKKNTENGNIFKWVEDGAATFGALKDGLWDLGGIIGGIGRASAEAGGGGIFTLVNGLDRLNGAINSVAGQEALTRFFSAAGQGTDLMMDGIGDLLSGLTSHMGAIEHIMIAGSGAIGSAFSGIGDILANSGFMGGLSTLASGMKEGIDGLVAAAVPLGDILGAVGQVAGGLLAQLGPSLGLALTALSPLVTMLGDGLMPIIDILGGVLQDLFVILTPVIDQFTKGLAPILPMIAKVLKDVWAAVKPLAESIGNLLGAALSVIMPVIQNLAATLFPMLSKVIGKLAGVLKPVIDGIVKFIKDNAPMLISILTWIGEFIGGSLIAIIDGVANVISGVINVIVGIWNTFAALFAHDFDKFWSSIGQIFTGIWELIVGAFQIFMNIGIFGVVKKVFGLVKGFFTASMAGIKGLFSGFTTTIDNIWNSLWSGIWNFLKTIWDNIVGSIRTQTNHVNDVILNVAQTIRSVWDGLWSGLFKAGKAVWDNIVSTVTGAFGGMSTKIGDIFRGLKNTIDTIWAAIKFAVGTPINATIDFVNKGIIGGYNAVASKLGLKTLGTIAKLSLGTSTRSSGGNVALANGGFVNLPWSAQNRDPYMGITPKGAFRFEGQEYFVKRSSTSKLEQKYPGYLDYLNKFGDLPGHAAGGRVSLRGHQFTAIFAAVIQAAEKALGKTFRITQGGFRPTTSYSGTSHKGDAVDIARPYSNADVAALRARGVAAWDRAGMGNWIDHIHGVPLPGFGSAAGSGLTQAQSYLRGGNGLGGRDNGPRGSAITNFLAGIGAAIKSGFDSVAGWFTKLMDIVTAPFKEFTNAIGGGMIGDLAKAVGTQLKDGLIPWIKGKIGLASGTLSAPRGLSLVGEKGPELMWMNGGEALLDAVRTSQLLRTLPTRTASTLTKGTSETTVIYQIENVNLQVAGLHEVEDMRAIQKSLDKVPRMVRQRILTPERGGRV